MTESAYSYLSHHGIKGQEWGVRNGPPYPLEPSRDFGGKRPTKKQLKRYARGLTDEQLAAANKRLVAEQNYIKNVYTPTAKDKAIEFVKKTGRDIGKSVLDQAKKEAGKQIYDGIMINISRKIKDDN